MGAAVAVLAVALLPACGTSTKTSTATVTEPVRRVVVDVGRGDVVVTGTSASEVHVKWNARTRRAKPAFERHVTDGVLTLSAKCNPGFLGACRIDQRVEIPAHTEVEVRAGSGSVRIERAEADVTVQTGTGSIDLVRTGGVVHAQTGSGSITVDRASDELQLSTGSGSISAKDLVTRRLQVRTGSGSLTATFQEPPDDVDVQSASGSVDVALPKGSYQVDTSASGGGSIEVKGLEKSDSSSRHVRITTASGSIKVTGK